MNHSRYIGTRQEDINMTQFNKYNFCSICRYAIICRKFVSGNMSVANQDPTVSSTYELYLAGCKKHHNNLSYEEFICNDFENKLPSKKG